MRVEELLNDLWSGKYNHLTFIEISKIFERNGYKTLEEVMDDLELKESESNG